uniref:cardiac-enriched FHL2-interacting protein isoform X2 n=1 Tax=Semicossyphus pulcher TaxID=241346 RepID=UPI0037E736C4
MTANQQGALYSNDNPISFGNSAQTTAPNVVSSNTSTTPFNISQLLTPSVTAHQEAETSEARQFAVSPQPVEHPPVRAESRGATPDIRMSSYKSRATSLLFNLKDNRKRVKSTYSPTKFKGLETPEKNKQPFIQEPRDTVIDMPDFTDADVQYPQVEESSWTNAASHQYVNPYHETHHPEPATAHTGPYSEYSSSDYQTAQMQGEMVHHSGFTGFIPENYTTNQLANGQNLHEDLSSFTPYKQSMTDNVEALGGDTYRLHPSYTATEMPKLNADNYQNREFLPSKANTEQHFNETARWEFPNVDRYQQFKDNNYDYSNVSSQDRWRQTNSQDTKTRSLNAALSPWKQEITALMEKDQHPQAYQRAAVTQEELRLPSDRCRREDLQMPTNGAGASYKKDELVNPYISNQLAPPAPFSNATEENPAYYGLQPPEAFEDKYVLQKQSRHNKDTEMKDDYTSQTFKRYDQEYRYQHSHYSNKDKTLFTQEPGQRKQYTPIPNGYEMQSQQPIEAKPQFENNTQKNNPDKSSDLTMENRAKDRKPDEVKSEQAVAECIKAQHAQAELAKAQRWAQEQPPEVESARLNLAGQTGSEKVKAEEASAQLSEHEIVNQARAEHVKEDDLREEQTHAEQTIVQRVTLEPSTITEEAEAKHIKGKQDEQVMVEQVKAERFKEVKTELAETEQAALTRIKQSKTEQARKERIKAEQLEEEKVKAEQVEREWVEAEQIRLEKVKAEQAEAERRKAEQAELQRIKEQAKAEQEKPKVVEKETVQAARVNEVKPTATKNKEDKVKERKEANSEQTKVKQTSTDLKILSMPEWSAKPVPKLTVTQHVKSERDKVEQVKTELAKAKAELAKIKEKMRGEQKHKVRNTGLTTDGEIKRDVPVRVNTNKNEENKDQDQATKMQQPCEDLADACSQSTDQANSGVHEYTRLREKYGFIDTTPSIRNKLSATGNVSSSDANETPSLDKSDTKNDDKSKDKHSPTIKLATVTTEHKEEISLKSSDVTESQYIYSESSKEFKLSSGNFIPTNVEHRANSGTVTERVKEDRVEKLEKCDPHIQSDVSLKKDSDSVIPVPPERKPRPSEHSVGPGKDKHSTPHRGLSHKEKAQTKQEILTSKIKAHAEKEISAIRDGFISKSSTKQLGGSQSTNVRQRPLSQEVPKKPDSTISTNIAPKNQMEPSGIQIEQVKSVSPSSSTKIQMKSAATTSQLVDHSQKVPKEPTHNSVPKPPTEPQQTGSYPMSTGDGLVEHQKKSVSPSTSAKIPMKSAAKTTQLVDHSQKVPKEPTHDNVPKPAKEPQQTGSYPMSTGDGLVEHQKRDNQSGIQSPMQSKEQAPKNKQGKRESNHGESSGKQTDGLKDSCAVDTDDVNKDKAATHLVQVKSSKPTTTEEAESKHEPVVEDSAPTLNFAFGQSKTSEADDSLQITGIMVIVRERQPPVSNSQVNDSTQEQLNAKKEESRNSDKDKCHPSSERKGNESSKEVSSVETKDRVVQNTHTTVKDDPTEVGMNIHTEKVQEAFTEETSQNNVSKNVSVLKTDVRQESSNTDTRPQRETQLQEVVAEKGLPSTVSVPAKNKSLAETQTLPYKQDTLEGEAKANTNKTIENPTKSISTDEVKSSTQEKTPHRRQSAHTNENFRSNVVNEGINHTTASNKAAAETLIKPDVQPSLKDDITTVINPTKCRDTDGKSAALLEEKNSTPPKPPNKTSPPNTLTKNENRQVKNSQVDDSVHIDSIAIRVLPVATEDNLRTAEKHVTAVPSDVVEANRHQQLASSVVEGKLHTLNNEDRTKDLPETSSQNLEVQRVLSSVRKLSDSLKNSSQPESINATSQNIQAENGNPERLNISMNSVVESKVQQTEEDYFQVHGLSETNHKSHSRANVGETSDAVSGRELPGLRSNKGVFSKESNNAGTNEVLVLDQSKTVNSRSVSVQEENLKRKEEDNLASKQTDGPTERQGTKNEKPEAGQGIHVRKQHLENKSSLSSKERHSPRNSNPTRESTVKEKPDVKPTPKPRASTIPEISALADYARLKVIVSEDRENTIQEFPPNKKEGFFPLIQSRHSRRPVFTADPQELSVKEKTLPNKTEAGSKVNTEPKPLAFPIREKEHQRTGMFKLGDKERPERTLLDAKASEGVSDSQVKHAQHIKERNKSPTHLKNEGIEEQVNNTQRARQVDQSVHQSNNTPLQPPTSSSALNRPRNTSLSQQVKPHDNTNPNERRKESASTAERIPYLDNNFHRKATSGQVNNIEENATTLRKVEKIEKVLAGAERSEKLRQERLATGHEDSKAKPQNRAKLLGEEHTRTEEKKRTEDSKIKHIIEESRASLAEEERRAAQREEERRAREREAIAQKIKERREKQREAEKKAEKERQDKERAARKEEEMRAKQREEQKRVKEIEEKRKLREAEERIKENEEGRRAKQQKEERAEQEEQLRRAAQEEEQRRAAEKERQRQAAQEEKQRRAALEEQQRRAAQEKELRRAAQEDKQRRAAKEEQQRILEQEEQQRKAVQEEQQRRAVQEEQQSAAQEEKQRRAAQEEQQRKAAQEEQQRIAAQEEQKRRAAQEEQQRRAAQEEQKRRAALIEEQRRAKQIEEMILSDIEEEKKRNWREQEKAAQISEKERIKEQRKVEQHIEEQRGGRQKKEARALEERQAALKEEKRAAQERILAQKEERESDKVAQRMEALQYYAITSTDNERKPRERQLGSPLPPQQRNNPSGLESTEDSGSHTRSYRPHAPASPAPSLPRSNTSSPALGAKPLMFRVKDNTFRGSSFTKSVKPRFHKNFGEDFRVGSPMERGSERGEEEQETMRRSAGTPVHPDTGLNRLAAIKEFSTFQPASSTLDYSAPLTQHRPYSRRSLALDEDDSRSIISNMSEDVESFATSAADLSELRGLYYDERPESACSFSSDVSRSLGKPPVVPPKSEKALRRAKRLTSRRINKELTKAGADIPAGVERPLQDISSNRPSSSTELQ